MIEIRHLTKRFGNLCAVDDISLEIREGEIFAILGPNGSGKTTTLKCVAGLASLSSGEIRIKGQDVSRSPVDTKRQFSYLPQRLAFPELLTAQELLEFHCKLRKLPLQRAKTVLADSRFNGFGARPVREFSGGMMQRLGIALLALADSPVLLLDEPTTGLDPQASADLHEFLVSGRDRGKTVLLTSHILAEVEALADRVAILVQGRLVTVQSVASFRRQLMTASSLRIDLLNPSQDFISVAYTAGAHTAEFAGGCLHVSANTEDRVTILRALEDAGALIERFSTEEASLEDIYMRYVYESAAPDHLADGRLPGRGTSASVH